MVDPMHFDARADAYERARPPYPDELWDRLQGLGLLRAGLRVLDLGAGTGQATARFVEAGARVTAIEPGQALARRLRERLPQVTVEVAPAEEASLPPEAFDLALAATAVHWFDLAVLLPRLHAALVPDGRFAVWRNAYGDPRARTAFRDRVQDIVARRSADVPRGGPGELDVAGWVERLTGSGHFAVEDVGEWWWSLDLGAQRVHDLFSTFSDWSEDEAAEAARAVTDLGGTVTEHYGTWLVVLRRTAG